MTSTTPSSHEARPASTAFAIAKRAVKDFLADDAMTLSGALSFYTALSLAPLLLIVVAIAGFLWQAGDAQGALVQQLQNLIGKGGAEMAETVMKEAGKEQKHGVAAAIGIGTLLFGASTVFAQLQYSLNRIWNVEAKPGKDVWDFIRRRLLSVGMIFAVAFLLVVSLVMSTVLSFASGSVQMNLPGGDATWRVVNFLISLVVYTGIFTLIHHYLPDVKITWRDSLIGGVVTAVLFAIGKELLGWYLGQGSVSSAYGAAASFFVVLLWVYYSSLILFIGAEITQAFVNETGRPLTAASHARMVRSPETTVAAAN